MSTLETNFFFFVWLTRLVCSHFWCFLFSHLVNRFERNRQCGRQRLLCRLGNSTHILPKNYSFCHTTQYRLLYNLILKIFVSFPGFSDSLRSENVHSTITRSHFVLVTHRCRSSIELPLASWFPCGRLISTFDANR